jgi:hypothetical protein
MQRRGEVTRVAAPRRPARPRSPWPTAAWLAVPVLAGAAQVLRGAWGDAAIFLVPTAVLAADAAGLLPARRGDAARLRRVLPLATVLVGVVLVAAPRHGALDALSIAALGVLVLASDWPDPPPLPRAPVRPRSAALWAGAAAALGLWELANFLLGYGSDRATARHPVISDLLDPVADAWVGRLLLATAWVLAGVALLRRGRRR